MSEGKASLEAAARLFAASVLGCQGEVRRREESGLQAEG